mmetsp:Transcript_34442/g.95253  ORF Transcript_34442/g.95253 Transcript_34442/m.95253 type:complete len:349 (-) Transcript_34442:219-1265(-)
MHDPRPVHGHLRVRKKIHEERVQHLQTSNTPCGVGVTAAGLGHSLDSQQALQAALGHEPRNRVDVAEGASGHDGDPGTEGFALLCGMACQQHGCSPAGEVLQQVPQRPSCVHINSRRRLIQQHHCWLTKEGDCDGQLAPVPTTEVLGPCALVRFQLRPLQCLPHDGVDPAARNAAQPAVKLQDLLHLQTFRHCVPLRAEAHAPPRRAQLAPHAVADHEGIASQGLEDAGDELERRRLARTVGPEEAEALAGWHLHVQARHRNCGPAKKAWPRECLRKAAQQQALRATSQAQLLDPAAFLHHAVHGLLEFRLPLWVRVAAPPESQNAALTEQQHREPNWRHGHHSDKTA